MKVKEKSEKADLKFNTQKTKIMASGPIISWQIGGKTMETVTDFIFSDSNITADGYCSHEIKRRLLLGRKAMTKLEMKWSEVKLLSRVWLFATPYTEAYRAPLSMGFSRQEYWIGLPWPS